MSYLEFLRPSVTLYHYSKTKLKVIRSGFDITNERVGRLHKYLPGVPEGYASNELINFFTYPMKPTVRLDRLNRAGTAEIKNPAWTKGVWYEHKVVLSSDVIWRIAEILLVTTDIADSFPEDGTKEDYRQWHYETDRVLAESGLSGSNLEELHEIINTVINMYTYTEWMDMCIKNGGSINPNQYSGGVPHVQLAIGKVPVRSVRKIVIK